MESALSLFSEAHAMLSAINSKRDQLVRRWYNAVVRGCGLDRQKFQLAQGVFPLPNDCASLWSVFDFIPPKSIDHWWNPAQLNSFAQNYGGVINNLIPTSKEPDPVAEAIAVWNKATSHPYCLTVDALKTELASKPGANFTFVPDKESGDVGDTWASGNLSPVPSDVMERWVAPLSALTQDAGMVVTTDYQNIGSFVGPPVRVESATSEFSPWYVPQALRFALENNEDSVWGQGKPTWEQTFGAEGNMQRSVLSIVIVDGTTTTAESRDKALWDQLKELWDDVPFLPPRALASPVRKKLVSAADSMLELDPAGQALQSEVKTPLGNPYILGVDVVPIEKFLA